jgi:5-methylcytosine-specific restriction endonuclease McrA
MSNISKLRRKLCEAQNHRCAYCGDRVIQVWEVRQIYKNYKSPSKHPKLATLDHVIPKTHGGKADYGNSVVACKSCNEAKSSMDVDLFVRLVDIWQATRFNDYKLPFFVKLMKKARIRLEGNNQVPVPEDVIIFYQSQLMNA